MSMITHSFNFDPTYGYTAETLTQIAPPPTPADFAMFWQQAFQETAAIPLNLRQRPIKSQSPKYEISYIQFDTLDDWRVGGWLMVPREGDVRRAAVMGHGYGGRGEPDTALPLGQTAVLFPCAPGFNLSARDDTPDEAQAHVIYGIESREGYILRPCVAAIWSAVSVLQALFPDVEGEGLFYLGNSFGGGLGALALPWDKRVTRAWLGLPTFGHHPLRLQCECVGSGEAVRLYVQRRPAVREVLAYYDAAIAAQYIETPVLVSPALFDPAVPPPGQFAVTNALRYKQMFVREVGHFEPAESLGEMRRFYQTLKSWFAA